MFDVVDADGGGGISKEEFLELMQQDPTSEAAIAEQRLRCVRCNAAAHSHSTLIVLFVFGSCKLHENGMTAKPHHLCAYAYAARALVGSSTVSCSMRRRSRPT